MSESKTNEQRSEARVQNHSGNHDVFCVGVYVFLTASLLSGSLCRFISSTHHLHGSSRNRRKSANSLKVVSRVQTPLLVTELHVLPDLVVARHREGVKHFSPATHKKRPFFVEQLCHKNAFRSSGDSVEIVFWDGADWTTRGSATEDEDGASLDSCRTDADDEARNARHGRGRRTRCIRTVFS